MVIVTFDFDPTSYNYCPLSILLRQVIVLCVKFCVHNYIYCIYFARNVLLRGGGGRGSRGERRRLLEKWLKIATSGCLFQRVVPNCK